MVILEKPSLQSPSLHAKELRHRSLELPRLELLGEPVALVAGGLLVDQAAPHVVAEELLVADAERDAL
eukprot:5923884-Heterocapsa_arctica.AAC.1